MSSETSPIKAFIRGNAVLPVFIGALLCVFLLRSGIFALFFLVPLGFISFKYESKTAWTSFAFAALGNAILVIRNQIAGGLPFEAVFWDVIYFTAMIFLFTWMITPPSALFFGKKSFVLHSAPGLKGAASEIPGSPLQSRIFRFACASGLGAIMLTVTFYKAVSSPDFYEYLSYMFDTVLSAYRSSASEVVEIALIDSISAASIIESVKTVMLRGGSLISCVLLFSVCRQLSFFLVWITSRKKRESSQRMNFLNENSLVAFKVNSQVIWIFSGALFLVVITRIIKLEIPEIVLWNILIFCVILYFAQGLGIIQFFFARPAISPFLRLLLMVFLIVMLFSPVLNAVLLTGFVVLGIAENWVPLRAPKKDGPPSTPEAGE
jgi:hypothetical protein